MIRLLKRKEPTFDPAPEPVVEPERESATKGRILRTPRRAPTGDLTRSIRKDRARHELDLVRDALDLSSATFEAVSVELLSHGGPILGEEAIAAAMASLFDCEPVGAMTSRTVVLVGGSQGARMRAALALSQRIERAGRRVALYSLQEGRFEDAQATYRGGLDILHVGTVEACIDAVRVKEPAELAIVDASCLDGGADGEAALPMLTLALNAEAIYVGDGRTDIPGSSFLPGIERIVLSGRTAPKRFGATMDAAYHHGWAFAGQCSDKGIWHPVTPATLADRFAMAVR